MQIPNVFNKITYKRALEILLEDNWFNMPSNIKKQTVEAVFKYEKDLLFKDVNFDIKLEIYSNLYDGNYEKYFESESEFVYE